MSTMSNATEVYLASCFPNGRKVVHTSAKGFLCGLDAISLSLRHQFPLLPTPSVDELKAIANRLPQVRSSSNYSEIELLAVLQQWANDNNHGDFALGYVEGSQPLLVGHHLDDALILWIHNDDFQASNVISKIDKRSSAKEVVDLANKSKFRSHWSGIRPKDAPVITNPSQSQKDAQPITTPATPVVPAAKTNALPGAKKSKADQSKGATASTAPSTNAQTSTTPVTKRSVCNRAPSQKQAEIERDTVEATKKLQQKKTPPAATKKPADKSAAESAPTQQPPKTATSAAPATEKPGYVCHEKNWDFVTRLLADFNKHRRAVHGLKGNLSKKDYEASCANAAQPASTTSIVADGQAQSKKRKTPPTATEPKAKKANTEKAATAAQTKATVNAGKPTKMVLRMSKSNDA
jgi:hypothetical protein